MARLVLQRCVVVGCAMPPYHSGIHATADGKRIEVGHTFEECTGQCDVHYAQVTPNGDQVDHPAHYGGENDPYEAIKVIEAWDLGFSLGNAIKYIARAGKKADPPAQDLRKAAWYLNREIERLEGRV